MSTINSNTVPTIGWGALFANGNGIKAVALALGVMLHATNIYLATTIMPSIVKEIGGLEYYAWNTTLFVVASVIGAVISANRLALLGPKKAYQLAIFLFFIGALLCTVAPTMYVLLFGRFVQGLGGGLLFALSYAMIRIVFEAKLWARAMALVSGMWGIAAFSGPFIGGVFAENNQWRWAFGTLLIISVIIFVISSRILPTEKNTQNAPKIPFMKLNLLVAAALAVSIGSVLEHTIANIAGVVIALLFLYVLIRTEKKSRIRLLPTGAYEVRNTLGATYLIMTLLTIATAIEIFVPYFAQVMYGFSPLESGYLTVLIAFGWTFSSLLFSGVAAVKVPKIIKLGIGFMLFGLMGLAVLTGLNTTLNVWLLIINACFLFMMGVGIGMGWPHLLTKVFSLAPKGEEELTSASVTTVQLMATTFGASLAGLLVNMGGITNPGGVVGAQNAATLLYGTFALAPLLAVVVLLIQKK